ncbi:unnamed protein product [Musa acuminata var. zebrina]
MWGSKPTKRDHPKEDFGQFPQSPFKDFCRNYMDGFGVSRQRSSSRSAGRRRGEERWRILIVAGEEAIELGILRRKSPILEKLAGITAYAEDRNWRIQLSSARRLLGTGHSPSVMPFMGLVDGFCKKKGVKEAENVVKRLQEGDVLFLMEKAVGVHLDKTGPFSPMVLKAIVRKKNS